MFVSKGYEIFVRNLEALEEGVEHEVEIRDTESYRTKTVRAEIASPDKELPGSEPLWVLALVGHRLDERPWKIKITKVIKER